MGEVYALQRPQRGAWVRRPPLGCTETVPAISGTTLSLDIEDWDSRNTIFFRFDVTQQAGSGCTPDTKGVLEIVFKYVGGDCAQSDHDQGDKGECSGDPGTAPVVVVVTNAKDGQPSLSPSSGINVGDLITLSTTEKKLKSATAFSITGSGSQLLEFHTSCSAPLDVGDQFGSLLIVDMTVTED